MSSAWFYVAGKAKTFCKVCVKFSILFYDFMILPLTLTPTSTSTPLFPTPCSMLQWRLYFQIVIFYIFPWSSAIFNFSRQTITGIIGTASSTSLTSPIFIFTKYFLYILVYFSVLSLSNSFSLLHFLLPFFYLIYFLHSHRFAFCYLLLF